MGAFWMSPGEKTDWMLEQECHTPGVQIKIWTRGLRSGVRLNCNNDIWMGNHSITWLCFALVWKSLNVHKINLSSVCLPLLLLSKWSSVGHPSSSCRGELWRKSIYLIRCVYMPTLWNANYPYEWLSSVCGRCDSSLFYVRGPFLLGPSIVFLLGLCVLYPIHREQAKKILLFLFLSTRHLNPDPDLLCKLRLSKSRLRVTLQSRSQCFPGCEMIAVIYGYEAEER